MSRCATLRASFAHKWLEKWSPTFHVGNLTHFHEVAERYRKFHGVVGVRKPRGCYSRDIIEVIYDHLFAIAYGSFPGEKYISISRSRRMLARSLRMGHGGTLDPIARGVLVIGFNEGCKKLGKLLGSTKSYSAMVVLGVQYDSDDVTGVLLRTKPFSHVTRNLLEQAILKNFLGHHLQIPPMFSNIKVNGTKALNVARKERLKNSDFVSFQSLPGKFGLIPRPMVLHSADITYFRSPYFCVRMSTCSGFFVRSFIRDLGENVGTVASMSGLVRIEQDNILLSDCLSIGEACDPDIIFQKSR